MRPLILSCNTGAGHNTAGSALREQFLKSGVDCQMLDALSFASESLSKFICEFYVGLTVRAPGLFGAGYRACEAISSPKRRSASYIANAGYAHTLYRYLADNRIDTVLMTHIFPAQCLTHIRKKYRMNNIRTYLISTDYDCCPFAEETSTDAFFIPHDSITADFLRRGVGEERVFVSGIPTLEKFSRKADKDEARRSLHLPQEAPIILIMGGSMGFGNIEDMVRLLRNRMRDKTNIVVLGGNNERLKSSLRARFGDDTRVHVIDYTNQADLYMDACDIMLSKPGGLSSTEAAVKNVPLVHMAPIPGCETDNQQFFNHFGMSVSAETPAETADAAIRLLERPELQQAMISAQKANTNARAAEDIVRYVMGRV
ncbi:MAG: glycosyltransferase [Eubacteriales bacterium]|nr:glycosyltransferase [Eubacteriales bacterium]